MVYLNIEIIGGLNNNNKQYCFTFTSNYEQKCAYYVFWIATTSLQRPNFLDPFSMFIVLNNDQLSTTATTLESPGWSLYIDLTWFYRPSACDEDILKLDSFSIIYKIFKQKFCTIKVMINLVANEMRMFSNANFLPKNMNFSVK